MEGITGIVTIFNEEDNCERWLDSYFRQNLHCNELIIVDGGSTDNSFSKISSFIKERTDIKIKLVLDLSASRKESSSPIARGRNVAISKARFNKIVCFDFGCEYSENYVEEMSKSLQNFDVVGGFFSIYEIDQLSRDYSNYFMPKKKDLKIGFIPSSRSLAFKKRVWQEVGGYKELYITGEDTDFINSVFSLKKFKIGYNTNLNVKWESPKNFYEIFKKHCSYAKGKAAYKEPKFHLFPRLGLVFFPIWFLGKGFVMKYLINFANVFGYINFKFLNTFSK